MSAPDIVFLRVLPFFLADEDMVSFRGLAPINILGAITCDIITKLPEFFARAFFAKMAESLAKSGPPPLALPVVIGEAAPVKIANMVASLNAGDIAPVEMIFRKPE